MKSSKIQLLVRTAILAALATVLMFIEVPIPIPFFPSFLKLDPSDIPAVFACIAYGPVAGVTVQLIKNLFHVFSTITNGVGEFANFLIGASVVLPYMMIRRQEKPGFAAILSAVGLSVVSIVVVGLAVNHFITLPLYSIAFNTPIEVFRAFLPAICVFNGIKGIFIGLCVWALYRPLMPALTREGRI